MDNSFFQALTTISLIMLALPAYICFHLLPWQSEEELGNAVDYNHLNTTKELEF